MQPVLEVQHLRKTYKTVTAVSDVSFSVRPGEIVGLLGPNGAGKTTTISMILGLLTPTEGSVSILGKDLLHHRAEILRQVNFAAVYAQLPTNLSVRQNLIIFALLYGVSNAKSRVAELLREFDLERFAKTKSGLLSSGEQSRMNLAKAFLNNPKLLLLDEPTASLDPSTADIIRTRIRAHAEEHGTAIVWTSHNMLEIERVCDRVLFISHGKILIEGNPKTLPQEHDKANLEELFISIAREPLETAPKP